MRKILLVSILVILATPIYSYDYYNTNKEFVVEQDFDTNSSYGIPVYSEDDCIGAAINGVCYGSVIPSGYTEKCYGQMLFDECTGPQF